MPNREIKESRNEPIRRAPQRNIDAAREDSEYRAREADRVANQAKYDAEAKEANRAYRANHPESAPAAVAAPSAAQPENSLARGVDALARPKKVLDKQIEDAGG